MNPSETPVELLSIESLRQRLQASERECERWRSMCESAPDYMAIVGLKGEFLWFNRVHPNLTRAQALASTLYDFTPPDGIGAVRAAIAECRATGTARLQGHFVVTGEEYWSDMRFILLEDRPDQMLLVTADATARVLTEKALEESTSQLRTSQRLSRVGYWEIHLDTSRIVWNDAMYAVYGCDPTVYEPTMESVHQLTHPVDKARLEEAMTRAVETGEQFAVDYRIVVGDREVRHLLANGEVAKDALGVPSRVRGCTLDVTRVHGAERAARFWEARLRAAVSAAHQVVYSWSDETDELSFAGDAERFFGTTSPTAGEAFAQLIRPPQERLFPRRLSALNGDTGTVLHSYDLVRDGKLIRVEEHCELLLDSKGRGHIVGLISDISLHTEEQERWKLELAQRDTQLREVHHRVNNNLQLLVSLASIKLGSDSTTRPLMDEFTLRIHAIALCYNLAAPAATLDRISINAYVQGILDIASTLLLPHVRLVLRPLPDLQTIARERAVPCGLLLLELLTRLDKQARSLKSAPSNVVLELVGDTHLVMTIVEPAVAESEEEAVSTLAQALLIQLSGVLQRARQADMRRTVVTFALEAA